MKAAAGFVERGRGQETEEEQADATQLSVYACDASEHGCSSSSCSRPASGDCAPVLPNNHLKREFEKCCYRGNPILWAPLWEEKEEENVNDCVCECVLRVQEKPMRRFHGIIVGQFDE